MKNKLLSYLLPVALMLLNCTVISAQTIPVRAVSDLNRVFEDGYSLPAFTDTIKLFGLKGEVISGQCVLQAKKKLTGATVEVTGLNGLPAGSVEWNFVGTIPLSQNTPNQPLTAVVRKAPAKFPDYLMPDRQLDISEKSWKAVWLTVEIPSNANPGKYQGRVVVKSKEGEGSVPVSLTVLPLTLPETRNLKVTEWYSTDFEQYHGIKERYSEEWFAMLRVYAENMAEHRQNVFQVPAGTIIIQKEKNDSLTFDFTRFDQIADVFWGTGKMDYIETGELTRFGNDAWFSTDIVLRDFKVQNTETGKVEDIPGSVVLPKFLPAIENHLRDKGWLSKSYFHVKDEPSMHNAAAWREVSRYVHQHAPDLKRMDAIETTNLLEDIEVPVPKLDAFGTWYDQYKAAHLKGLELWFYTVGIYQGSLFPNKTIDMPVIESRIMHWLNYRYDATGYLHWGWNQWDGDPYKETGMHIGDGWHVYPAKDGVVNSLRWEEMRNGIQDYECFMLLEKFTKALKDSLGSRASWIDPKRRGKEIAARVVPTIMDHTQDPAVLYHAKSQLVSEIIDFNTSPKVYIQTHPEENTTISNHSSVEVFGWTEPGTTILINGRVIPVNMQGFFFEQFGGNLVDTTKIPITKGSIRLRAIGESGTKDIVRDFNIK